MNKKYIVKESRDFDNIIKKGKKVKNYNFVIFFTKNNNIIIISTFAFVFLFFIVTPYLISFNNFSRLFDNSSKFKFKQLFLIIIIQL